MLREPVTLARPTRALLLQGPVGPFFRHLAEGLRAQGVEVTKVNFNPADSLFYRGPEVVCFRRPMSQWPDYLGQLLAEREIDCVFLFGDCRPMHRQAVAIATDLGVPVWVFEEGYLRPNYVTMERGGVNGNSSLPREPTFYRRATRSAAEPPPAPTLGNTFVPFAIYSVLNAVAITLLGWRYPDYRHHRNVNAIQQSYYWVRGAWRKLWYSAREAGVLERLSGEQAGRYFFVPLQVHLDSQLHHSDYAGVEEFIEDVVATFAEAAPEDTLLVLKHHPLDRAYRDYTRLIRDLGRKHGCEGRLVYVHDLHLPTLLKKARGVITMNSTVGVSALFHGAPVKVLGRAVYDIPGLTSQAPLASFFRDPGKVDASLFEGFCSWLRATNQIPGSFYKGIAETAAEAARVAVIGSADEAASPDALDDVMAPGRPAARLARS